MTDVRAAGGVLEVVIEARVTLGVELAAMPVQDVELTGCALGNQVMESTLVIQPQMTGGREEDAAFA